MGRGEGGGGGGKCYKRQQACTDVFASVGRDSYHEVVFIKAALD